jgi:hypothetical protein
MGIYDQLHGVCPHCNAIIGRRKGDTNGFCGIQTKAWITNYRTETYDFFPGDRVPYLVDQFGNPIIETYSEYCYDCDEIFIISFSVVEEMFPIPNHPNCFEKHIEVIMNHFEKKKQ